jgi:hypothetical protein
MSAATEYQNWIASLGADELRAAKSLGVHKFDQPSGYGRSVETWQQDRIEAPDADPDDDDWSLRVDLLAAGADPDRLDDICEAINVHGETIGFRHARRALHAITLPLMRSTSPKLHGLVHAMGLTLATFGESAEICRCTKQAIHCHIVKWRGLLDR